MKANPPPASKYWVLLALVLCGMSSQAIAQAPPSAPSMPVIPAPRLRPVAPVRTPGRVDPSLRRVQDAPTPPAIQPGGAGAGTAGNETDLTVPRAEKEGGETNAVAAEEAAEEPEKDETKLLMNFLGMEDSKLKVYGWIQNSYTYNANGTHGRLNPFNFGDAPNFLANRWMGNQYYLIFEKPLEQNDELNFGFRADNLFGNDWQFNYMQGFANGAFNNNHLGYDLAQIYAEMHVPDNVFGTKGIDFKGGRWYTIAGYEVVPATGRPLLSVPYMFNFGQPFTHFGMLSTWHITDKLNVYNGAINGWDRWVNTNYKWGYIGGFSYTFNEDKTNIAFTTVWGPNQFPKQLPANQSLYPTGYINIPSLAGKTNKGYSANDRVLFTTVVSHKWTDRLTQVVETDQGYEQNVPGANSVIVDGVVQDGRAGKAAWYSFGNWFLYKFTADSDKLTGVWRSEIFRDNNGVRTGIATNYSEFTLGLIYKPVPHLWIRPEARYDFSRGGLPYDGGTKNSQFTLGFDVILLF